MSSNYLPDRERNAAREKAGLLELFWTFLRIGALTLGGGLAMAAVMRHELVHRRRWMNDEEFLAELSTTALLPGPIAVNLAYLQGRRLRGGTGSAAAVLGVVLPSFCIILLMAMFALPYMSHPRVAAFFRGCALAVAGQLAFVGFTFGRKPLRHWRNILVCATGLLVAGALHWHPIWAVVVAGLLGYWICPHHQANGPPSQKVME